MDFKSKFSFENRLEESSRIKSKFPGRIPVIVEKSLKASPTLQVIDKSKFLVPGDLTVSQFIFIIRKRIHLSSETAMFLFVNGTLPTTNMLLRELYTIYCDKDGFLYMQYTGENTFGEENKSVRKNTSKQTPLIIRNEDRNSWRRFCWKRHSPSPVCIY